MRRRAFLTAAAGVGLALVVPDAVRAERVSGALWKKRLTGLGTEAAARWGVVGAELGVPYEVGRHEVGFLFGDTFSGAWPESRHDWRSVVMLRSRSRPGAADGIVFDAAAGVSGNGRAPGIVYNGRKGIGIDGVWEETVIPTDGISFPESGRQVISYVSVERRESASTKTSYAGLAYSDNGKDFTRTRLKWWNNADNSDPFQLWTMQRDGDWVYVFSVPAGRQHSAMMLRRVRWDRMLFPREYEGWGRSGRGWAWGRPCTPILTGRFGEPSVRRLRDDIWVMSYLDASTNSIVTRTSAGPNRVWSPAKAQVTWAQESHLYGGFIHPWSTSQPGDLHLLVSTWKRDADGRSTAYHVSQYAGTA